VGHDLPVAQTKWRWRRVIVCLALLYVIGVAVEFAGYWAAY
jgi:hypothetical protein